MPLSLQLVLCTHIYGSIKIFEYYKLFYVTICVIIVLTHMHVCMWSNICIAILLISYGSISFICIYILVPNMRKCHRVKIK